mmetsp:Transcript_26190/g.40827  ORF Transcript_26190/g.40827 Transcript_26190/m.40827 type:complete len:155 (+) Transcript_26190:782-1246(+)|eukprot:CAMPEP_0201517774 /NCGR_PEP_ID=MMETSP0161_2-20130828/8805_1 /ASSEMBLY_ACC=CAM_ASM_000251 /TAXON_ID=180227 /ORGANISM="Neoparamoeba aestuarina, Strain SoJaBio B1-5/56/2" /LENGTH=154 /DNA_ID=CAMNT_0047915385 /DNA_START=746 /DNA_END=1210 /DNA_ORIENTATION=+
MTFLGLLMSQFVRFLILICQITNSFVLFQTVVLYRKKKTKSENQQICSPCEIYHASSSTTSDDTPVILIVSLSVGGGVLLLVLVIGVACYYWRSYQKRGMGYVDMKINEVEMVEDLLRDSEDDSVHTIDENSDFETHFDLDTESDHSASETSEF